MIRLFVPEKLNEGATIALGAGQARYLLSVMRRGIGDELLLFNGADGEWLARIAAVDRRSASLELRAQTRPQTIGPDLELIVAVVKRPRLETIVEKATELGARRVRLAVTRFTQADRVRLDRLAAIATEAAEQTGRLDVPEIAAPEKLDAILGAWPGRTLIFCDEGGDALPMAEALDAILLPSRGRERRFAKSLANRIAASGARVALSTVAAKQTDEGPRRRSRSISQENVEIQARPLIRPVSDRPPSHARGEGPKTAASGFSILIGPEGGFSPEERARLRGLPYVIPVSLGPRILRADTAAIAALVLWQSKLGDWAP
ncbi:MAG TPA: 16S rRNA (uracil(1498)-N(3))-methyltransferase [Caulobacteraceae bacterium]|nr:16S rRNA (uracil(1498)-N(3))-methyltransferase [Caulobacteraceae bacterium]